MWPHNPPTTALLGPQPSCDISLFSSPGFSWGETARFPLPDLKTLISYSGSSGDPQGCHPKQRDSKHPRGLPGLQPCPQPCPAGPSAQWPDTRLGTGQRLMLEPGQGQTRSRALSLQFEYQRVALETLTAFWSEPAPCRIQAGHTTHEEGGSTVAQPSRRSRRERETPFAEEEKEGDLSSQESHRQHSN